MDQLEYVRVAELMAADQLCAILDPQRVKPVLGKEFGPVVHEAVRAVFDIVVVHPLLFEVVLLDLYDVVPKNVNKVVPVGPRLLVVDAWSKIRLLSQYCLTFVRAISDYFQTFVRLLSNYLVRPEVRLLVKFFIVMVILAHSSWSSN